MFVLFNWVILHNMFSGNFWLTLPIKTKTWPSGYKGLYMIWSSSYDIMIVVGYVEQERKPENIWILVKHIKKCNSCLSQEAISQAKISVRALFSSLVCQGSPLLPLSCLSHASIISYISPVLSLCHSKGPPTPPWRINFKKNCFPTKKTYVESLKWFSFQFKCSIHG